MPSASWRAKHVTKAVHRYSSASSQVCCRANVPEEDALTNWLVRLKSAHPDWTRTRLLTRAGIEAMKVPA